MSDRVFTSVFSSLEKALKHSTTFGRNQLAMVAGLATLATLADRIDGGAVRDLAAQLPGPLQDALLPTTEEAEAFSFEEFINRVAERTRRKSIVSESAVAAVMATLRDAVTPGEFDDILSQLPTDFQRLGER